MLVIVGGCCYFLVYNAHLPTSPPFDILAAFCGLLFVTNMSVCMFPTVFLDVIFQTFKLFAKTSKTLKIFKNLLKICKILKIHAYFQNPWIFGKIPKIYSNFTNPVVFFFIFGKSLFFLLAQIDFFKENLLLSVKRPNSCTTQLSLQNSLFQPKFSHKFGKIYLICQILHKNMSPFSKS